MHLPRLDGRTSGSRRIRSIGLVASAVLVTACSTAVPAATKQAQAYTQQANLKLLDLPSGWSSQGPASNSLTTSTLSQSQSKTVHSLLSGLPAICRPLDATFTASLVGAPPVGTIAQSQSQFSSASDGNAQISSTVAVFANLARSRSTYALYATPSFSNCLQQFLRATLTKVFNLSSASVTVTTSPTPVPPTGVKTTAFSVAQSGAHVGSQSNVSVSDEMVIQSGKAMAFVEVQSATTSLPPDALNVFYESAAKVVHRLVSPPS